jgi:lactate permease
MASTWAQVYNPFGLTWLSALVAGIPILVLLGLLASGVSAPRAALVGLASALAVAVFAHQMPIVPALAAAGYGACYGLFPIGWIVFAAVFLYHLTVRSGQFEIVKRSVAAVSPDRRVQALLIAFSFGAFLEGAAGFGTPVAISAALLIGLGFTPLYAAGLALLANTSPVAFGALGTPIAALAKVSEIDPFLLSQMAGRQLPFFSLAIPAWLVLVMSGWKGLKGCWPAVLVCGSSFAAIQFVVANFHGPMLVDVAGGLGSLVATAVFLKFWKPREVWRFPDESSDEILAEPTSPSRAEVAYAWTPWIVLSAMVFLWGWPSWKDMLNGGREQPNFLRGKTVLTWDVPFLHQVVRRVEPAPGVPAGWKAADKPEDVYYDFNWLSATGTAIFLSAVLAAFWLRIGLRAFFRQFAETLYKVRWALATIALMLALARTTTYSGADVTLSAAFTWTGWFYPFFAPLLGWLGVALTGSDTSANVLFGNLQHVTAKRLGLDPVLIVTSNSTGGVMGKMIDAQSIVVASTATRWFGQEGTILRYVFLHSLVLAGLVGLVVVLLAYVPPFTLLVPGQGP